jgi:hypothetical protein
VSFSANQQFPRQPAFLYHARGCRGGIVEEGIPITDDRLR